MPRLTAIALLLLGLCTRVGGQSESNSLPPPITAPPQSFFARIRERDREPARQFYRKHLDAKGLPVAASAEVTDQALRQTYDLVTHLLAGRPDIISSMASNGMYLIIIGKDQLYTDMPEYSHHPNPAYQNERVGGTGGLPTSFGEENLLCPPVDRYDDESIGLHEFCHTIDSTLRSIDPTWSERRNRVYQHAVEKGLWKYAYVITHIFQIGTNRRCWLNTTELRPQGYRLRQTPTASLIARPTPWAQGHGFIGSAESATQRLADGWNCRSNPWNLGRCPGPVSTGPSA